MSETDGGLRIFMMRHGKPRFPGEGSYMYGHTDYPLSEEGVLQAERIGEALRRVRMERIVSSDLSRAARTAEIFAGFQDGGGVGVELEPELREVFMGEWEGLRKEDAMRGYGDIFRERGLDIENVAAPGGETLAEASDRGMRVLSGLIGGSEGMGNILVVAHSAILWGVISSIFGIRMGDVFRFRFDYCALHLVEYGSIPSQWGKFRLARYNWSPGLTDNGENFV